MHAEDVVAPEKIGSYRIVRRLGLGGTSEVLLAVSTGPFGFERTVVLKRLLRKLEWDPVLGRMLAAEALAYSRLSHPAIVRLYDFFEAGGHVALVLEHVDGVSLSRLRTMMRARNVTLGDAPALYIGSRVFAALAAAHSARDPRTGELAQVVHRDVSPGNVLVPWDGYVKLMDFGLAKVTGVSGDSRSGTLKGTYGYMAPEQVTGETVTPRTDVYAACLVLRELLLGKPAFVMGDMAELEYLRSMADSNLAPIETLRRGISPRLADALRRGLARNPDERTLTASEMVAVLKNEVSLESARMELVERLGRVRVVSAPDRTTPRLPSLVDPTPSSTTLRWQEPAVETPNVMTISAAPEATSLRARILLSLAAAMITLAACAGLAMVFLRVRELTKVAASASAEVRSPIAPSATAITIAPKLTLPVAPPPPAPAPKPASTTGDVTTPASAHSHRVFLDGHVATWHSGATLHVACGPHMIRVGSAGAVQSIDVPCGGTIAVDVR